MRTETNQGKPRARNKNMGWKRRYPIGAEVIGANETHFRLWAPKAKSVDLVLEQTVEQNAKHAFQPLLREDDGYFSGHANVGAGALYRFRVRSEERGVGKECRSGWATA